jgi:hypothetical protein
MGVDFQMVQRKLATAEGVVPATHMKWGPMGLVIDLLDECGVLDEDAPGPIYSKSREDDGYDVVDQRDPADLKWEAEQASAFAGKGTDEDVAIPALKFSSNDGWLVFPAECMTIARALRSLSPEVVQKVLEADEDEMAVINDRDLDDPQDMPAAIRNVLGLTARVADYCERAADYGGFRVF